MSLQNAITSSVRQRAPRPGPVAAAGARPARTSRCHQLNDICPIAAAVRLLIMTGAGEVDTIRPRRQASNCSWGEARVPAVCVCGLLGLVLMVSLRKCAQMFRPPL